MKPVRVILSPEAEEVYTHLNKEAESSKIEKSILDAINHKIRFVKENPHYGESIGKKLIPKEYAEKYGVTNLFKVDLPSFWRMLYTLTNGGVQVEIIAFILDVMDHKQYNKKFGYKGK